MTPRHFAWQAWRLVTSTFVSRCRHGAWRHPPSSCVAGVALMTLVWLWWRAWSPVTPRHFAWQAWRLVTPTVVSCGRRGAWRHPPSFCVAGVALGWLKWRAWSPVTPRHPAWQAWHLVASTVISRGRHGTWRHPPCFAWQASRL